MKQYVGMRSIEDIQRVCQEKGWEYVDGKFISRGEEQAVFNVHFQVDDIAGVMLAWKDTHRFQVRLGNGLRVWGADSQYEGQEWFDSLYDLLYI